MKKAIELAASGNVRDLEELADSEVCLVSLLCESI